MLQLPKSFKICSDKEAHLLEYIRNFQRRFNQLHPERRLLMFAALNECSIEKCICTSIRPSHSDYIELYHWESCAAFIANFFTFEPLEEPLMFPTYLPSPSSVLSWQRADCFDLSIVLVSFLTGAGYEAFCVVGYAPLHITTNSQEAIACPYIALKIEEEKDFCKAKENQYPTQKTSKVTNSDYIHEALPVLNGEYLELQERGRNIQVTDFIGSFRKTFDHDLQMGENEEEDNLVLYCKERPLPKESLEQKREPQNIDSDSNEKNVSDKMVHDKEGTQLMNSKPFDKRRLHCWVLVTTNKRDVFDSFFLEPSTGHRYSVQNSPYQAVEYIWNQHNIFINMQLNKDSVGVETMSWDLKDITKWERVLDTYLNAGDTQELSIASSTKSAIGVMSPGKKQDALMPNLAPGTDNCRLESGSLVASNDKLTSKAGATLLSKETTEIKSPEDPNKNGFVKPYHWLLPASWVPQLKISMDAYVTRCPKGVKKTHYYRCTHELYSFYGDFVRWDGLIERIILYEDDERTNVIETHDYFQRRKDGLRKRIFIPGSNKVHDYFDSGASFGLKETELIDGQSRKFLFYPESRNDGLTKREEVIGKTIVECFTSNEACLLYRRACYGPPLPSQRDEYSPKPLSDRHLESSNAMHGETSVKGSISRPGSVRLSSRAISHGRVSVDSQKGRSRSRMMSRWQGSASNRRRNSTPTSADNHIEKKLMPVPRRRPNAEKLLPLVKITQKYELRSDLHQKNCVAKHVFNLSINQIKVDYHHVDRHITTNSRVYNKDGSLNLLHADPFSPELSLFDKLDEFNSLVLAEREAIKSIRDTEREIEETLQQRLREEQNVVLITPYIDIACVKQDDLFQDGEDAIKLPTDYLSPFLPPGVRPRQKLTRQQMLDVRDSCLRALKERLVNRATVIQRHYDDETSHLSKRRTNFERDREQMTVEDEEAYNQDCENALFRIRILEFRAKQHEEEALKKYLELEKKLQNDPRLARLYRATSS